MLLKSSISLFDHTSLIITALLSSSCDNKLNKLSKQHIVQQAQTDRLLNADSKKAQIENTKSSVVALPSAEQQIIVANQAKSSQNF